jgi:hypothetical protein
MRSQAGAWERELAVGKGIAVAIVILRKLQNPAISKTPDPSRGSG